MSGGAALSPCFVPRERSCLPSKSGESSQTPCQPAPASLLACQPASLPAQSSPSLPFRFRTKECLLPLCHCADRQEAPRRQLAAASCYELLAHEPKSPVSLWGAGGQGVAPALKARQPWAAHTHGLPKTHLGTWGSSVLALGGPLPGGRAGETYLRLGGPHSRLGSPLGKRYVPSSTGPSCPWCRQSSSLVGDNAGPVPSLPLITTAAAPTTQHCRC